MNPDEKMISAQKAYENMLPPEQEDNSEYFQQQAEGTLELVKTWIQDNFDELVDSITEMNKFEEIKKDSPVEDRLIECVTMDATIGKREHFSNSNKSQAKYEVWETLHRLELDENVVDFMAEDFEKYLKRDNDYDSCKYSDDIIELIKIEFLS